MGIVSERIQETIFRTCWKIVGAKQHKPYTKNKSNILKESYYSLTLNYRNSEKLSNWTRKYCYDKSIFAESYRVGEDIEIIDYDRTKLYENIVNIVKKYSPNTNIGIIIPREDTTYEKEKRKLGNKIYDELKNELSNEYKVEIYQNEKTNKDESQRDNVDFGVPSIKNIKRYV